eukprot:g11071.t1
MVFEESSAGLRPTNMDSASIKIGSGPTGPVNGPQLQERRLSSMEDIRARNAAPPGFSPSRAAAVTSDPKHAGSSRTQNSYVVT